MIMTIPFRCATRHKRGRNTGASNAATKNLLEYAWGSRHTTEHVEVSRINPVLD